MEAPLRRGLLWLLATAFTAVLVTLTTTALDALVAMKVLSAEGVEGLLGEPLQAIQHAAGAAALLAIFGLLITHRWAQEAGRPRSPASLHAFAVAGALLLAGFAAELTWHWTSGHAPLMRWGAELLDLAAVIALAIPVLVNAQPRTSFAKPQWAWTAAAFIAMVPLSVDSIGSGWLYEQRYIWLLLGAYPAALAVVWGGWQRHASPDGVTARWTWIGVGLFLLATSYLLASLFDRSDPTGIVASYYLVMLVMGLNLCVLIALGLWRLVRAGAQRPAYALLVAGMVVMLVAIVPGPVPDWEPNPAPLVNRLGFDSDIAIVGLYLVLLGGMVDLLRRHSGVDLELTILSWTWVALALAHLGLAWYEERARSYALWVVHATDAGAESLRARMASVVTLLFIATLLALVRPTWRIARQWHTRPAGD